MDTLEITLYMLLGSNTCRNYWDVEHKTSVLETLKSLFPKRIVYKFSEPMRTHVEKMWL